MFVRLRQRFSENWQQVPDMKTLEPGPLVKSVAATVSATSKHCPGLCTDCWRIRGGQDPWMGGLLGGPGDLVSRL